LFVGDRDSSRHRHAAHHAPIVEKAQRQNSVKVRRPLTITVPNRIAPVPFSHSADYVVPLDFWLQPAIILES
jgi:hypothetical protein